MKINVGLALTTGVTIMSLVGSAVALADSQGKWWTDPDTGTFSMVDPESHVQVAGCTTASTLPTP